MQSQVVVSLLISVLVGGGVYYTLSGSEKEQSAKINEVTGQLQATSAKLGETSKKLTELIEANEKNVAASANTKPTETQNQLMMAQWKQEMCTSLKGTWSSSPEKCEVQSQYRPLPMATAPSNDAKKEPWKGLPKDLIGTGTEISAKGQTQCVSFERDGYCEKVADGESFVRCRTGKKIVHEETTSKKGNKKIRFICVKQ